MEEYLKAALEIVKAQASVRTMTDDEITSMLRNVAAGIQAAAEAEAAPAEPATPVLDPAKAVKESPGPPPSKIGVTDVAQKSKVWRSWGKRGKAVFTAMCGG